MRLASFEAIAQALEHAGVRYLVAGGLAVNAHGYPVNEAEIDWKLTTWEGSRRATLRRWARLGLREKLRAVEEMAQLTERLHGKEAIEALRRRRR